jgi:hypothetical protein
VASNSSVDGRFPASLPGIEGLDGPIQRVHARDDHFT